MPDHHYHIQIFRLDVVLSKSFPNNPFKTIPVHCARQNFLAGDYSKPGVAIAVANKKNLDVFIRDIFGVNYTVKVIFAQQSVYSGKLGRCDYTRRRVLHGLWRDGH